MIHFGIIGAGDIARKFADAVRQLDNAEVIAVASKSLDRAQEWAAREHIPSYYGNYAELLANPRIDAVYIATTTNAHYDNIAMSASRQTCSLRKIFGTVCSRGTYRL